MDWISTTTGCFAVSNAVAKTALDLDRFVRNVRESRADLTALSAELHALDGVLDLLKDDAASASFPADMALQTPAVVAGSGAIVADLDALLSDVPDSSAPSAAQDKRAKWLAMRRHIDASRTVLEVYRLTLGLALDLVALTTDDDGSTAETARILAEIGHLRGRVRSDLVDNDSGCMLQNYLDVLQKHASFVLDGSHQTDQTAAPVVTSSVVAPPHDATMDSPLGKAPDSAVDVKMADEGDEGDEGGRAVSPPLMSPAFLNNRATFGIADDALSFPRQSSSSPPLPPRGHHNSENSENGLVLPTDDINDLLDELRDELPSRPPTPPPKALARGSSALGFHGRTASMGSASIRISTNTAVRGYPPGSRTLTMTATSPTTEDGNASHFFFDEAPASPTSPRGCLHPAPARPPPTSLSATSSSQLTHTLSNGNISTSTSTNSGGAGTTAGVNGFLGGRGGSTNSNRFSRFLRHMRSTSGGSTYAESIARPATAASGYSRPPIAGAFIRHNNTVAVVDKRASRRFSASFRSPWAVTTSIQADTGKEGPAMTTATTATATTTGGFFGRRLSRNTHDKNSDEPDAVFGVSLRKSIHMAGSSARTHHSGSHGSSRREFPLCVFKCYNYIRDDDGLDTPGLFGSGSMRDEEEEDDDEDDDDVSWQRVRALRDVFSAPPDYGAGLDLAAAGYTRHDAAALVLEYLAALPRPLVPETVARRWVTLSRQATVPGSSAKRLDQCIDFWEEALGGVRGPGRSLLKLLLNLWGDIADAADRNDMTAERLAGQLLQPLMHLERGRYDTDFMLSLAFIIRKRSEYALLLRGGGRKSNAAFEV